MKKKITLLLVLALVLGTLSGCRQAEADGPFIPAMAESKPEETTEPTVPMTTPPDGDSENVTCQGSYTGQGDPNTVVARAGDMELTNGLLQAFYWAEAAAYRQSDPAFAPDFDKPLDMQVCAVDADVNSWQQYFLGRALNAWHAAAALKQQSRDVTLPTEEDYQPDAAKHEENMTGMPANEVLYGYHSHFYPNSMHQAYLDRIPELLEQLAEENGYADGIAMAREAFGTSLEDLKEYTELYNYGYMYFTRLGYELREVEEEMVAALAYGESSGSYVDVRQILLYPQQTPNRWRAEADVEHPQIADDGTITCSEELWEGGEELAKQMLRGWKNSRMSGEEGFADMAHFDSMDFGSAADGGAYRQLRRGQWLPELEEWCFDESRKPGDTTIIRTAYGIHILYFSGRTDIQEAGARNVLNAWAQEGIVSAAEESYPMTVDYSAITLNPGKAQVGAGDLLYQDVAHERYPEAPLYVQQDYPTAKYGAYLLRTHGCGITTMAMLASYMTDTELTPPVLARRYGRYCSEHGSDGILFNYPPAEMGFYLKEKTFDSKAAKTALAEGYPVVVVQGKGFWTRGGHYLLLEKMNEDGSIQVRDSNLLNYGRLEDHKNDRFDWSTIPPNAKGYWIFEKKLTAIPACARCGHPEDLVQGVIPNDYICEKCRPAMLRRDTYLNSSDSAS